jgi:hypothetical protein
VHAAGQGGADGQSARPGRARPGQGRVRMGGRCALLGGTVPMASTRGRAGLGRGRWGRAGWPVRVAGWGETELARAARRGMTEASRADDRHALHGRAGFG